MRKMLDIWPPLPILVVKRAYQHLHSEVHEDNLIAAVERHDRVSVIDIDGLTCRQLERVAAMMQEPFPTLTYLRLSSSDEEAAPTFPITFMGGAAPLLRHLYLKGISFPTLPNLVLSPTDITTLNLHAIPSTGYISPREMVAFLSPLIRLERVAIEFKSPHPPPDPSSAHVIPSTCALLPALEVFQFKGVSEYLEDMVSHIDAPLLNRLEAIVFNQLNFTIPRTSQFIQRVETLKSLDKAALIFDSRFIEIQFFHGGTPSLLLHIPCSPSDWQLSSVVQLCSPPLPLLSTVEWLYIHESKESPQRWQYDRDHEQWPEILQSFTSVRELYISHTMWPLLAPTLQQHTGEWTMDVLPMLCGIFLEGLKPSEKLPETIEPVVTAHKLAGRPVIVHRLEGGVWKTIN